MTDATYSHATQSLLGANASEARRANAALKRLEARLRCARAEHADAASEPVMRALRRRAAEQARIAKEAAEAAQRAEDDALRAAVPPERRRAVFDDIVQHLVAALPLDMPPGHVEYYYMSRPTAAMFFTPDELASGRVRRAWITDEALRRLVAFCIEEGDAPSGTRISLEDDGSVRKSYHDWYVKMAVLEA